MEAFRSIPSILSIIDHIPFHTNSTHQLLQYKQKIKKFIDSVTKQVFDIIESYEQKISFLTKENQELKVVNAQFKLATKICTTKSNLAYSKNDNLDQIPIAKSKLLNPQTKRYKPQNDFEGQDIFTAQTNKNAQNTKSIFEMKNNSKKQREEELISFLQIGQKNMKLTTDTYLSTIGRSSNNQSQSHQATQNRYEDSQVWARKKQIIVNHSLSSICYSLENSFVARRARSNRPKGKSTMEEDRMNKYENGAEQIKSKGVQNLLLRLRENVQNSPKKSPEIIKSSITSRPYKSVQKEKTPPSSNGSKVMICPVTVDLAKRNTAVKRQKKQNKEIQTQCSSLPIKSILKHSSTFSCK